MKRIVVVTLILSLFVSFATADDTFSVDTMKTGFQDFADEAAAAIPLNALVGLNWSDAYIGQLLALPPNLGLGVTFGATTIPYAAVEPVLSALGIGTGLTGDLEAVQTYGLPIPAIVTEARVGGIVLPFDIGIKVGMVPQEAVPLLPDSIDLDYLSIGADVRYALIKGNALLPKVSVGASYNYLKGSLGIGGLLDGTITLTDFEAPDLNNEGATTTYTVSLIDPAVSLDWETNVIEAKAQVSKKFLFLTPYAGVGVASGFSKVGGGLAAGVTVDDGSSTPLTQTELDALEAALEAAGEDAPDLDDTGFYVQGGQPNALALRAYGGLSLNLLFVYLDVNAMYNLIGRNWGGSVGLRVQL